MRIPSAALSLVLAILAASCGSDIDGLPTYWNFTNETADTITIVWHRENGEQTVLVEVPAGESAMVHVNPYGNGNQRNVCEARGELVAVDSAGREVARSPMHCNPWVIEASGGPEDAVDPAASPSS